MSYRIILGISFLQWPNVGIGDKIRKEDISLLSLMVIGLKGSCSARSVLVLASHHAERGAHGSI